MKFETKFNLDDHIWYMKNNKPVEVVINRMYIYYVGTSQDTIAYSAGDVGNAHSLAHTDIHEYMAFASKAALLESL